MRRTPGGLWVPDHAGRVVPASVRGYRAPALRTGTRRAFGGVPGGGSSQQTSDFLSFWSGITPGTGSTAKSDNGKWNYTPVGPGGAIVATTGLGFPAGIANCYRADWNAGGNFNFVRVTGLPIPSVGESLFYRTYFRCTWPYPTSDTQTHYYQDGFAGPDCNWAFQQDNVSADTWRPRFQILGSSYPEREWASTSVLNKGETYRIEHQIHRLTTTTFNLHARFYDSGGSLVLGDGHFKGQDANDDTLADTPTLLFSNVANLDGINAGCNDSGSETGVFGYQSGFGRVRGGTWIGAFGGLVGES